MSEEFVSVIMPAYNEERWVVACFHRVVKALEDCGRPFEIVLEEDGSTDRTPEIICELAERYPFVKALHFPRRMGKGFGVRMGLKVSGGSLIVLLDSDMEYPPEKIPALLDEIDGADIVVGGRVDWRNYKTKVWRRLSSIVYILLLKCLFGTDRLLDPQSGFKAFRREVIEAVSPLTSNGFEIDTEILLKALRKGYTVKYLPITYTYKGNSKVDMLRDPPKMLISVLRWKIHGKFRIRERKEPEEEYLLHRRRKAIEDKALRFDQAEIGYKSKNPLARLFFDRKTKAILRYALDRKRQNILDVGCGDGAILGNLRGEFLVGLDLSLTRLERARSRVKKGHFVCGDAEHLPFRESSFELALCLDTLEHLPHPLNCVRGLESSTAKGGLMLVSVPDDKWLSLARLLAVRYPISLRGHGHIHTLKPRDVVELFKGCRLVSSCKIPVILPVVTLLCMENS